MYITGIAARRCSGMDVQGQISLHSLNVCRFGENFQGNHGSFLFHRFFVSPGQTSPKRPQGHVFAEPKRNRPRYRAAAQVALSRWPSLTRRGSNGVREMRTWGSVSGPGLALKHLCAYVLSRKNHWSLQNLTCAWPAQKYHRAWD